MCNSSLLLWDHQATGRDCSLSTTSVDRRSPLSMPRVELGIHGLNRWAVKCWEMLRNAEFKQPDWRLCQEGQEASFPISHIKPFARGNATEPAHITLACVLLPPAGNWVCFACQIPPLFVLSHGLPMVNTMGKLALFWRFSVTASFLPSGLKDHYSLATRFTSQVPHPTIVGVRRRCRAPSRVQHSHPADVNMLHNATFSGFGRSLASLVFGATQYRNWTYVHFSRDSRRTRL